MEQHSDIDELLRRRLYDAEVTPPAFVWPNVENALRKKKRRIFFWIFGSVCAASLAYGSWFMLHHTNNRLTALNEQAAQTAASSGNGVNAQTALSGNFSNDQANNTSSKTAENSAQTTVSAASPAQKTRMHLNNAQSASGAAIQHPNTAKRGLPNNSNINSPALASAEANTEAASGAADPDIVPVVNRPEKQENTTGLSIDGEPKNTRSNTLNNLPLVFKPLLFGPKLTKPGTVPFKIIRHKKESKACYDFGKHPNVWMVDAYAGPAFAFKELSTNNPEFQHYLERRQDTEHRDWAFNAGIRGTLMLEQHFMLRFGLHYDQMTEVFELIDPNSIIVDVQYTTTYNANGVPVVVADTIGVRYGENYFKSYNRFGMLDIPLQLGVELRKGRMGFNINAGFSFNIWFWKQGAYLTSADKPRYFTPGGKNTTEIYRTRTGLSAIGSVQWFYHLQPRLRVFAEPYFRQIVQPVNLKTHPVGQRYGVGGIRFGITKILD